MDTQTLRTTMILVALFCIGPFIAVGTLVILRKLFSAGSDDTGSRLPEAHAPRNNGRGMMQAPKPVYYTENPDTRRGQCPLLYLVYDGAAPAAVCSPNRHHLLTMAHADGSRELIHVTLDQWEQARMTTFAETYTAQTMQETNAAHERGELDAYEYRIAQQIAAANAPYDERTYGNDYSAQQAYTSMLQRAVDNDRAHQRDINGYLPHEQAALPSGEDTHVTAAWREIYSELPSGSGEQLSLGDGKDYVPYTTNAHEPRLWELENWHEGKRQ